MAWAAAMAWIQSLAWELPYAVSVVVKFLKIIIIDNGITTTVFVYTASGFSLKEASVLKCRNVLRLYIFFFLLSLSFFFCFLGLHPWHMEVVRLGV